MALHAQLAPFPRERAVGAEQEGRAFDPHIGAAVILLFDPGAERRAQAAVLVRGEADGQPIFVAEIAELRRRVARNRDHMRAEMRKYGREASEILYWKSTVEGQRVAVRVDLGGGEP